MARKYLGTSVFDEAIDRMVKVFQEGHRVVVTFSAGKDSTVAMEICSIANQIAGTGEPLDVVMRDEEIMLPGTFEFAERTASRSDINFHWLVAGQPIINAFNRKNPYWWVFDNRLKPEQWVRTPPDFAKYIDELNIDAIATPKRFPPEPGKDLIVVMGLRVQESPNRRLGIASSGGYLTKKDSLGRRKCRPIYDWSYGDVWKAIRDNQWDYNKAYDVMNRLGVSPMRQRIGPPTMSASGADELAMAMKAWPTWFDKVAARLEGVRTVALFGRQAIEPHRKLGETWEGAYQRLCIDSAPQWIAERSIKVREEVLAKVKSSGQPELAQKGRTNIKGVNLAFSSWEKLTKGMYNGDPFCLKQQMCSYIEPEFFRDGAGKWGGIPQW